MKTKVFSFPKEKDFIIPGELIKIEVYHNSFGVFYQFEGTEKFEHQLIIRTSIYPINTLVTFFQVNGKADKNYFVQRPKELLSP
ncbi:hypothetical protein SAMN04489761_3017 [Tenacibaculum sp. MAR_2009_124]|uniref:hypothetical protein n=1 Tax=Tenacibaculum sp. MAR_2009_124 TaxID=1250059 RepID=UPI0008976F8C|nr:hypothetical protein [Tenacibaculum sp. MAR_2009_124]SEC44718.1 hypothetical protein SAMN04489761_3017 [Tenacibaculum sp. MAR_2009_124]